MSPEQQAAYVVAQTAEFNCRVAGMVAENMQRQALGHSMAYTEVDFAIVAREYSSVVDHNSLMTMFTPT